MKKLMVIFLSFVLIAALASVFSCSSSNPEEPQATNTPVPTSTNTPVPATMTPTQVSSPTCVDSGALYTFTADQTGDWSAEDTFASTKTYNTSEGYYCAGSMQVTGDFSSSDAKGTIKRYIGTATDFTGKTITAWINIPADLVDATNPYGVQIFVQDGTWGWDATWINITASGWQQYQWVLPASLNQDITQILQVGIQISAGTGSPVAGNSEDIYFDDITW